MILSFDQILFANTHREHGLGAWFLDEFVHFELD